MDQLELDHWSSKQVVYESTNVWDHKQVLLSSREAVM